MNLPIRHYIRRREFGVVLDQDKSLNRVALHLRSNSSEVAEWARRWDVFSFNIEHLSDHIDQGQQIDMAALGDCRLPYPSMWLEAGPWAAYLQGNDSEVLLFYFVRNSGGIGYAGCGLVSLDGKGCPIANAGMETGDSAAGSLTVHLTYFSLMAVELINSKRVEIHYRGEILKERVPPAPTCPIKMSVMPTVRLREGIWLKFESGKGHGEPCERGRRWHCVMSHLRWITRKETGKKEQVRVKSHWRGNKDLGTVRPGYIVN